MYRVLVLYLLLLSFALLIEPAWAQQYGTLSGRVLDLHKAPVADATVYAVPVGVVWVGIIPHTSTDAEGHYRLPIRYGRYSVSPAKPNAGYPPLYLELYNEINPPEVEISGQQQSVALDLQLGKKAGYLTGTVTDADTGKPVGNAAMELRREENRRNYIRGTGMISETGQLRTLVPSDTPVLLTIFHDGYQNWSPTHDGKAAAITLAPGQSLDINVQLKRSSLVR
ncbi:MAG TPA: carboxypeptidase-like regulatory domain-containing protein [Acidobacteriaceae bacterium]|nr:carboxypeptidase-like regulatory domain-containing protein [Acidobacteriaceae bacterium]